MNNHIAASVNFGNPSYNRRPCSPVSAARLVNTLAPDGHKIAVMSGQTAVKDYVALPGGGAAVYARGARDSKRVPAAG